MATTMTDDIALKYSTFTSDNNLELDDFIVFQDVDIEHLEMMQRYETLKSKTYTTADEKLEMTTLLTELEEYMPTSDTWNKLCACIRTMQMFFRDGIVVFVKQKQDEFEALLENYHYKGDYNNTTDYVFGNLVRYSGFGFICLKECIGQTPNVDVDTDYWLRFTLKGDKGDPSLNVSCKGNYSSTTTYNIGDACVYDGRLYYAVVNSTLNILPTVTSNWATMEHVAITSVEPSDKNVLWVDSGNSYAIKIYNKTTSTWGLQTLNGKTASGKLTTTEQTNLVNAINELNTNKANVNVTPVKDGTIQTSLNAEMVGGKHASDFASSTGDFNQGTTNIDTYSPNKNWSARIGQSNGGIRPNISQYSTVLNVGAENNSNFQMAGAYDGSNKIAYRTRHDTDGVYGSWKRILNEDDYNTLFQYASNGKTNIVNAITGKGGTADSSMTFTQLSTAISNIQTKAKTANGTSNATSSAGSGISIGVGYKPTIVYFTYDTYKSGNYVASFTGVYVDSGFTNAIGFDLNKAASFSTVTISDSGFVFKYNNTADGTYGAILRNWRVVHMEY
jgi:hypothetical protein